MAEAIITALITGVCAVVANIVIVNQKNRELMQEIRHQSEVEDMRMDAKLEKHQAVTDEKIAELTREVRKHNGFGERIPVLEEKINVANHRISDLEAKK